MSGEAFVSVVQPSEQKPRPYRSSASRSSEVRIGANREQAGRLIHRLVGRA